MSIVMLFHPVEFNLTESSVKWWSIWFFQSGVRLRRPGCVITAVGVDIAKKHFLFTRLTIGLNRSIDCFSERNMSDIIYSILGSRTVLHKYIIWLFVIFLKLVSRTNFMISDLTIEMVWMLDGLLVSQIPRYLVGE